MLVKHSPIAPETRVVDLFTESYPQPFLEELLALLKRVIERAEKRKIALRSSDSHYLDIGTRVRGILEREIPKLAAKYSTSGITVHKNGHHFFAQYRGVENQNSILLHNRTSGPFAGPPESKKRKKHSHKFDSQKVSDGNGSLFPIHSEEEEKAVNKIAAAEIESGFQVSFYVTYGIRNRTDEFYYHVGISIEDYLNSGSTRFLPIYDLATGRAIPDNLYSQTLRVRDLISVSIATIGLPANNDHGLLAEEERVPRARTVKKLENWNKSQGEADEPERS